MKWAGLDSLEGKPSSIELPSKKAVKEDKEKFLTDVIGKFTEEYAMTEFDGERLWRRQQDEKREFARGENERQTASSSENRAPEMLKAGML